MLQSKNPPRVDSPKTDMLSAVRDINVEHKKDLKRKKKKSGRWLFLRSLPGWFRTILIAALIVLALLIADGVRRESRDFSANMALYTGTVMVSKTEGRPPVPPVPNLPLSDKGTVMTGPGSYATLVFTDGSALLLAPNTQFQVRLMDYVRGGRRDRSFMVESGSVVARVSKNFGSASRIAICTPNAVATSQTGAFRVAHDPRSMTTTVQVIDGTAAMTSGGSAAALSPGQQAVAVQYGVGQPRGLSSSDQSALASAAANLTGYEKPPNVLQKSEQAINNFIDPLLQVLGVCPGGWGYDSIDYARRQSCKQALSRLRTQMEGASSNGVPEYVNTVTLAELSVDPVERDRMMSSFYGAMLESFQKTAQDKYVIYARARNKKHTLYMMTETNTTVVKE